MKSPRAKASDGGRGGSRRSRLLMSSVGLGRIGVLRGRAVRRMWIVPLLALRQPWCSGRSAARRRGQSRKHRHRARDGGEARRCQRRRGRWHDGAPLGRAFRQSRRRRPADSSRRQRQGRQSVRGDAALAGVHQRQRGRWSNGCSAPAPIRTPRCPKATPR